MEVNEDESSKKGGGAGRLEDKSLWNRICFKKGIKERHNCISAFKATSLFPVRCISRHIIDLLLTFNFNFQSSSFSLTQLIRPPSLLLLKHSKSHRKSLGPALTTYRWMLLVYLKP